jgi:hypothetical protein
MKRSIASVLLGVALPLGAAIAVTAPSSPAMAQWVAPPPPPSYYVAGYQPIYYNGYAHYYYGGYWHYRGRDGRWNYYRHEPEYLGRYRGGWGSRYHGWRR